MSGQPSYIELGVPDADRAVAFYGAVLGWAVDPSAGMTHVSRPTLSIGVHGGVRLCGARPSQARAPVTDTIE